MARGGKAEWKLGRKTQFGVQGSDDSDEDYVVEEDELSNEDNEEDLGDYCSDDNIDDDDDVEGFEEEEDFDSYEDEEEEVKKKPSRPKRSNVSTRKKTGAKTSRSRKRITYKEREEDDCDFDDEDDDEDEDEEFTPEEFDCLEEEEELVVKRTKRKDRKVTKAALRRKPSGQTLKRKRSCKVLKRNVLAKNVRKPPAFRGKPREDSEDDFNIIDEEPVVSERSNKNVARRRKLVVQSDSDFVSSESSDEDFTISDEEREQVREASKICRDLVIPSRSSCCLKTVEVKANSCPQKKPPGRKGKEKIEEIKNEASNAKQVCGICLSEEGKRTTRGTLNCCSHYFCFACILEWSKVESRCPLCKQRFMTISKPSKANVLDVKDVISIPERDQVYQPSEEEIRGYLDPYENVICTECHEGGDDDLMLLCDLCDSPAHTYCVGLGREVPEGNWYCKDCRSDALASLNAQAQDSALEQRATDNNSSHRLSPFDNFGNDLDGLMSMAPTPFTQGNGIFPSPRYFGGDFQAPSPRSGVGVLTLSGRRRIHRQIQSILSNNNRWRQASNIADSISAFRTGYNNSQNTSNHRWEAPFQHTPEAGTSYFSFLEEGLQENPSLLNMNVNPFSGRLNNMRQQVVQEPTSTSGNCGHGSLCLSDNQISQDAHLRQSNNVAGVAIDNNILHNRGLSHVGTREGSYFVGAKEQVGSMVETFLTSMSRDIGLVSVDADNTIFKYVAWRSTQTVLAACGLEHDRSEVYPMQPPSFCSHIEATSVARTSLMKGQCISCFNNFIREVVKTVMNSRLPHFLQVRD